MSRGAAAEASSVKRKNAEQYSVELCAIINAQGIVINRLNQITKENLFDKIFEILDQDVIRSIEDTSDDDGQLWYNTCNEFCTKTKKVLDILRDIFYTIGKPIFHRDIEIIRDSIGLPRVLFFELLLYLIEKLSEKEYNKEYFEGFRKTVNESDSSGILSYGVSDIDYFRFVTNENVEKINRCLDDIDDKFTTDAPRQGNYTLAHVISSYCNLILKRNGDFILPPSQSDSQPDSDPNSLMNVPSDWRDNIQLATQDDIKRYNAHKVSEERRKQIEDTTKRDEEQVTKFRLKREEHARRMSGNTQQKDTRPECFYDGKCYQQGAEHWRDFQHKNQQGPIALPRGGRRSQSKRSKYNTVRCSLSSTKRRHHRHTRHTKHRRRTKHRRH